MTNARQNRSPRMVAISSLKVRRIATLFAIVFFILFIQFYFTSIKNSEFVRNTLEGDDAPVRHTRSTNISVSQLLSDCPDFGRCQMQHFGASSTPLINLTGKFPHSVLRSYRNPLPEKRQNLHVLLVAYARTGSSFIGDLMQSIPDSFYHFEPLHFIRGQVLNDSFGEARGLLGNLFHCNISQVDGFLPWQKKHKTFMKLQRNIRYWNTCSKNNMCFNGTYIDSFCRNQTTVITKTIRLNLLEASKLFTSHPELNLKIIYLLRDPRGTMNSRMKKPVNAWCKRDLMCSDASHFCSGLRNDVQVACSLLAQRPADFMVFRYEDISSDPYGVSLELMKFLGFSSLPDEVNKFLETHTYFTGNVRRKSKAAGLGYSYSTFRNSSVTAMSWRKELTFRDVSKLQHRCKAFLSAFGYHSYHSLSSLRSNTDLNTDLKRALDSACNPSNG